MLTEIQSGFVTNDGQRPFILTGWLKDQAAALNSHQQSLLDAVLFHFENESGTFAETEDGRLRLAFDAGNSRLIDDSRPDEMAARTLMRICNNNTDPCEVELMRGRGSEEIIEIAITCESRVGKLVIARPGPSTSRQQESPAARRVQARLRADCIKPLALTPEEEEKILKREGGKAALRMLHGRYEALSREGFSRDQLFMVACVKWGGPALECMFDKQAKLRDEGFTDSDIARMAAGGGRAALEAALALCDQLGATGAERGNNISLPDIVAIAAKPGGASALEALIGYYEKLIQLFSHDKVIQVASSKSSAKKLEMLADTRLVTGMESEGLSKDQIIKIAVSGPMDGLLAVAKECNPLLKLGYTADQITNIACQQGGETAITTLLTKAKELREKGLSIADIAELATQAHAEHTLNVVLSKDWEGEIKPEELRVLLSRARYPESEIDKFLSLSREEKDKKLNKLKGKHETPKEKLPAPEAIASSSAKRGRTGN